MYLLLSKLGECSCLCVATVYVHCLSFPLKMKKVCFLLFIYNVQVSINNNE